MKSQTLRRAGALLLALTLVCSLLTLPAAADDPPVVNSISLNTTSHSLETTDTSGFQLTATTSPDEAAVTWTSSNPNIATVDSTGLVRPVAVGGPVSIEARVGAVYAECQVTVTAPTIPVTSFQLHTDAVPSQPMEGDPSVRLTATVMPENATDKSISYVSDNPSVVSVNNAGVLTFLKAGTAQITATANGGNVPDQYCVIHVRARPLISSVTVTPHDISLPIGGKAALSVRVEGAAPDKSVSWISSTPSAVSVDSAGQVTVRSGATVGDKITITAKSNADPREDDICVVTVIDPLVPSITAVNITSPSTPAYTYVDPGQTIQLSAAVIPAGAYGGENIAWTSSDRSKATVDRNGIVTGVAPGKVEITATAGGFSDTREIEVSGILLSYLKRSTTTGSQGTTVKLTPSSIEDIYQYRDILVNYETFGNAKGKSINWESTNNTVAQVVGGRVTANYPGENVTITASVAGTGFTASFKVRVLEDVAEAIIVNMGSNPSYSFSDILTTLNSRSQSKAGAPLESVYNLKVSTKNGTLYYKYISANSPGHGVGGTESYYYQPTSQQMGIKDVTFIPSPGFNGTAVVDYNARATNGTTFTGAIRIEATATGDVAYSTEMDQSITFSAEHFSAVCQGRNGQAIRYITFDQPPSSRGTLYQDYAPPGLYSPKVSSSTRYYVSSKPSIDQITFVPAAGYVGDVALTYHCVDSTGTSYNGTVSIRVGSASENKGSNVEYSTGLNQRRTLSATDFNDASQRTTSGALNYIRFDSLPSTNVGRLYLNYVSSSSSGTQVTTGRNYYRNSTPRISNITFVPATGYSGTVTIPYTGTNVSGTSFSGNLIIHVGTSSSGTTVRLAVAVNQAVSFVPSAFNDACRNATGDTLNYIRFTGLPSSTYGALSYQGGASVNTSTSYYYSNSTRPIGNLRFTARGTSGFTTFGFTGYNIQGASFSGTVEVEVTGGTASSSSVNGAIVYTGSSTPITFRTADFQSACQAALGTTLASVQFNALPGTGRLYVNYSSPGRPGTAVSGAVRYSTQELDQIRYLPRAEYQGTVTIPYTAYDTQGGTHSGTVELHLSNSYSYSSFNDLAGLDWAKPSIEFLRQSGITNGYSDNTFRPRQAISRGEFTLMICRAFQFPTTGNSGFPDVPSNSVYAGAVASARDLGIVQGDNGLFRPDRPISRQSAMAMISRAMNAAGRTLPAASTSILSSYRDGSQVSQFARDAVSALIQSGAVRGTSDMRINPVAPISRAEMAVILHRVLTQ